MMNRLIVLSWRNIDTHTKEVSKRISRKAYTKMGWALRKHDALLELEKEGKVAQIHTY